MRLSYCQKTKTLSLTLQTLQVTCTKFQPIEPFLSKSAKGSYTTDLSRAR